MKKLQRDLKRYIKNEFGSQKDFALRYGVSRQFIWACIHGKKNIPKWIIDVIEGRGDTRNARK